MRILTLAGKDLKQLFQNKQTAIFLLVMPVLFTTLFGFMFGGFTAGEKEDNRLPVAVLDLDKTDYSQRLIELLESSSTIRLVADQDSSEAQLRAQVQKGDLVGAVIIPAGFMTQITDQLVPTLTLVEDEDALTANIAVENAVRTAHHRLYSAGLTASLSQYAYLEGGSFSSELERQSYAAGSVELAIEAWQTPPVRTVLTHAYVTNVGEDSSPFGENAFSQSSPAMMAQFAIAGLIGAAELLVSERRSRTMSRMLTTRISRAEILLGHFLAIFFMIFLQLIILVIFGQFFLKLNYFGEPLATLALIAATALATGAMGLLVGAVAKTSDQAVIFSLVPMFIFAGLGGAWMPLEFLNETVQTISKFTPVAWTMQGLKDVLVRGAGFSDVTQPLLALIGFTIVFFLLAVWRFRFEGE